jgi:hypothetical protein
MAWGVLPRAQSVREPLGDMWHDRWFVTWRPASAPWTAFLLSRRAKEMGLARPEEVDVWVVGLDVGKEEHFAEVLANDGERLFARSIANDEAALPGPYDQATLRLLWSRISP